MAATSDERQEASVVALVVESAVYVGGVSASPFDMPLRVGVFDESRALYDSAVFCNRGRSVEIDGVGSLALEALEKKELVSRDFDDVTRDLMDLLRNRYVVLYDHLNVFDVLRFELSPVQYFDVGSSRLVRNEALRAEGSFWPRTPSTVPPLALLWSPIVGVDVPAFGQALGRGLLEMFNRVRFNLPPIPHLPAPQFELSRSYRSTVYNWLPLENSIASELVADPLLRSRVLRSSRPLVLPSAPRPRPPFRFVVASQRGSDPLPFQTLNGLCRALPLAGVAFLRHCVHVQVLTSAEVTRYISYQRGRPADACIEEVYPVDLGDRYGAENAVREFLRLEDAEIFQLARDIKFAGVVYPDCV